MECSTWSEENWEALLLTIQTGNCILMLGPDASSVEVDGNNLPISTMLSEKLAGEIDDVIKDWAIDPTDLLQVALYYSIEKGVGRNELLAKAVSYYKQMAGQTSRFLDNIAALPFYFSVTSTPDSLLFEALKKMGKEPTVDAYNFRGGKKDLVKMGTVEKPLVFHLYGSVGEPQSLVLSERDLFDFLVAVASRNPPLQGNVLSELQNKEKSLLFLGFGFNHWYLRILMHILQLRSKESSSFALEQFAPSSLEALKGTIYFFRKSDYKIQICSKDLVGFAQELRERYEKSSPLPVKKAKRTDAPRVFICHASENSGTAAALYSDLEAEGMVPWLDREKLRGGDLWDTRIDQTIRKEIDYFIVLQSESLAEKTIGYVNKEINIAMDRQKEFRGVKFVIPVTIDDSPLLAELEKFQSIDLRENDAVPDLTRLIHRDQQIRRR